MKRIGMTVMIGIAAACWAAAGWFVVAPREVVVVRRLGRVVGPALGPGLHWHYPGGIDRLDRIRTEAVRRLTIGRSGPAAADQDPAAGEVMTGDLNLLRIEATVQYRVADPVANALRGDRAEELLARAAEASLARSLARRGVDAALRSDRGRIAEDVRDALQSAADSRQIGVQILGVSLTDVRPPSEVAADFAEAQSAESRREDRIHVARTYESVQTATAASRGGALREAARAEADRRLLDARSDADRFLALLAEVRRSREMTIRSLYIDSVQSLLARVRRKLVLPPGDSIDMTILGRRDPAPVPAGPRLEDPGTSPATPNGDP